MCNVYANSNKSGREVSVSGIERFFGQMVWAQQKVLKLTATALIISNDIAYICIVVCQSTDPSCCTQVYTQ